jgi:hypothetical protein
MERPERDLTSRDVASAPSIYGSEHYISRITQELERQSHGVFDGRVTMTNRRHAVVDRSMLSYDSRPLDGLSAYADRSFTTCREIEIRATAPLNRGPRSAPSIARAVFASTLLQMGAPTRIGHQILTQHQGRVPVLWVGFVVAEDGYIFALVGDSLMCFDCEGSLLRMQTQLGNPELQMYPMIMAITGGRR